MRKLRQASLVFCFTFAVTVGTLFAQPTIITLNENGFGTWFPPGAPGPTPIPFFVGPDPSGGVTTAF